MINFFSYFDLKFQLPFGVSVYIPLICCEEELALIYNEAELELNTE